MHHEGMKETVAELQNRLETAGYIADAELVTTLLMIDLLQRPLLIEGEAGVGKTQIAKALATIHACPLIRLQCYEGLDANNAVYEWNYAHQLLTIKLEENQTGRSERLETEIFSERYLLERPLLKAIRQTNSSVLLIDEVDRADEAFEAFLLELLSDFQITIPELGTIKAVTTPRVILTSNCTRQLSDALRRRCLYHYLEYPDAVRELRIIRTWLPNISPSLSEQIVTFVQGLRNSDLRKRPGIAETLDWSRALSGLGIIDLKSSLSTLWQTRSCLLKTQEDMQTVNKSLMERLAGVKN